MPDENAVESLMDQMHAALISADFMKLAEISPALEAALEDLPQSNDQALIARLHKKATRNAATAQAAGRGVRAAIRRLADVRQNAAGLVTYTEKGKRADYGSQGELSQRF